MLLTILGALLPWLLALGLPALIIVTVLRRSNARRTPAAPVLAPAAATEDD